MYILCHSKFWRKEFGNPSYTACTIKHSDSMDELSYNMNEILLPRHKTTGYSSFRDGYAATAKMFISTQ